MPARRCAAGTGRRATGWRRFPPAGCQHGGRGASTAQHAFHAVELDDVLPVAGEFDLIFLHDAMIDPEPETRCKVLAWLRPRLLAGGGGIVSHAWMLHGVPAGVSPVQRAMCRKP